MSRPDAAPCGTYSAYRRHQRYGEEPCPACLDARKDRTLAPYRRAALAAVVYTSPPRRAMRRAAAIRGDL